MAKQEVADYLLERLRAWDVKHVFGFPGDGINGILAAFGRADNRPKFIQSRHEEMSAFEAVGYAKFSGRVGVCMATSGPGAVHLLNGLYDAKLDHVPVVAIVGQTNRSAMGGSYQQEVDLMSLFKDVASDYVQMVTVPEQLPNVLDRAIRVAMAQRAPTALIIPSDVQELPYSPPLTRSRWCRPAWASSGRRSLPTTTPSPARLPVLNAGKKVAMLVGSGARGAREELIEVADLLGAGAAKALLGKDVLSDELPWVTGSIGLLGTRPSYEMMRDCDTLLTVGSSFPYTQFLPEFGQCRAVQIDVDGRDDRDALPLRDQPRRRRQDSVAGADPAAAAQGGQVVAGGHREERGALVGNHGQGGDGHTDPVNPLRLFSELSPQLPDNAIVTADSGSSANWYARNLRFRGDIRGSLSGNLATMGPGVPYGIGAKFAQPDRPVIVFAGDGAMQMNGMAELITIKRYWQEWDDPRLIVAILHNNDLNQVTWEMRAMAGAPKFAESQNLPDVDFAAFAASLGPQRVVRQGPRGTRRTFGATRCRPTVPPCWMSTPIPTCRRSRRMPPGSSSRRPPPPCWPATRTGSASSRPGSRPRRRSSCRTRKADTSCTNEKKRRLVARPR